MAKKESEPKAIFRDSLAVLVLNWNNYEDTSNCIESIITHLDGNIQIIVIDNNSTDRSLERLQNNYPKCKYVQNDKNLGFAGGMNEGIREARRGGFEYVFLLNNDVVLTGNLDIHELVQKVKEPSIGLITPEIHKSGTADPWFITGRIKERSVRFSHGNVNQADRRYIQNDYVPICCVLFRTEVLEELSDLPEEYFLYCEDVEFGYRLRKKGYKLLTDQNHTVNHRVGGSSDNSFAAIPAYYRTRNRHLFAKRNDINMSYMIFTIYSIWWVITRGIYAFSQSGINATIAVFQGEIDGWLGKTGQRGTPLQTVTEIFR
jgi:GT2 family glycosyltransferase